MKRFISFTLAVFSAFVSLNAQEAFKHLSIGVDLNTSGPAVQIAAPVVTDHLVLKAGASFGIPVNYTYETTFSIPQLNETIDEINSELQKIGAPDRIESRFSPVALSATPKLNMGSANLLLEYYPFKKSSFHLTCGAYFGFDKNLVSAEAAIGQKFFDEFDQLTAELDALNQKYDVVPGYTSHSMPNEFKGNVAGRTLEFNTTDKKSIDVQLGIAQVRPYFGLGFGRSIPKSVVGVQFDLGAWYHGAPVLGSSNEVTYDASANTIADFDLSILDKAAFYPVVSFKIIVKII